MKRYQFLFSCILFYLTISAQNDNQRDNIWLLGYSDPIGAIKIDSCYDNSTISFSIQPIAAKRVIMDMYLRDDIAIINDTSGQLLFYTNGIYIADKTHKPMKNGEGLNPGKQTSINFKNGLINGQGSLILPKPQSNNLYYLIHSSVIHDKDNIINDLKGEYLYYTLVDMNKNDYKGEVIEKNQKLLDKFIDLGKITATRHANGIDWWIIVADFDTKNYNIFLLSSEGVKFVEKQTFSKGSKAGLGQAVFSPDGTKYARFNAYRIDIGTQVDIFDFNRCTGKLSNQRHWNYTTDTTWSGGIAISPNSKYLYVMSYKKIYQFDLQVDDVFSTLDTVAVHDGVTYNGLFGTRFYLAQLAPDNKIYISIPSTSTYYHVIEFPDKKGKACNVVQRGFKLPTKNYTTIPNFPYFRLGAAANNCITSTDETIDENVKLYPNPSQDFFTLDKGLSIANSIAIYDINGRFISSQNIENQITIINATYLKSGIYYCRLLNDSEPISLLKFTIIR